MALLLVLLALLVPAPLKALAESGFVPPHSLTVTMDRDYPPYSFATEDGRVQGIMRDLWDLWSAKTGVALHFLPVERTARTAPVDSGQADVVGYIVETGERMQQYLFAPEPPARLEMVIFFDQDITGISTLESLEGFTVGVMALRPRSRGYVHLNSTDPLAHPKIDPNYLADPDDGDVLLAGIKAVRGLAETSTLRKFVIRETRPGDAVETDEQIRAYIRATTQTTWHVVGSCKMGNAADAVVDSELRVHGMEGLRVIDSSVFPTVPSSNTNAPTIALGEKGADLVLRARKNIAVAA